MKTSKPQSIKEAILCQAMQAYADCVPGGDPKQRQLNWRASHPVSREEAIEIMKAATPEGYNEFRADVLRFLPGDAQIYLAREGSPAIYVKGEHSIRMAAMKHDEIEYHSSTDETRFWWD